jgi:hypothetical protein
MIVAKLTISYDRGTVLNKKADLGAGLQRGDVTANGGIVRGLGSHFRSQADMEATQARDKEAKRIYRAFRERFLTTSIDGLYIVPAYGEAEKFIAGLNPDGVVVRVSEWELTKTTGIDVVELSAWAGKIKNQLTEIGLGRGKKADQEGIEAVKALADCPVLSQETRDAVKNLVALVESAQIDRSVFKSRLENLNIEIAGIDKAHDQQVEKLEEAAAFTGESVAQ